MSTVFFTDRDLGKQFPALLRNAGISVERHGDHFPDDAKDEDWIVTIGRRGWVVLTHDKRIRYKPNELAAVRAAGVGMFVLSGKVPYSVLAQNFVNTIESRSRVRNRRTDSTSVAVGLTSRRFPSAFPA